MSRLRVGVIGCGGIAQIQHLPHLVELSSDFEIAGLCDLSRELLAHVGAAYGVPPERQHVDYQELVERADIGRYRLQLRHACAAVNISDSCGREALRIPSAGAIRHSP